MNRQLAPLRCCSSLTVTASSSRALGAGLLALASLYLGAPARLHAAYLFSEDFQGYTSFPDQIPANDPVNKGLPLQSEGADAFWYGGRFEPADGGTIDSDLAVQKYGGGSNGGHTGRFEDEAGLLFHIDTELYSNVTLGFQWRTFLADSADRLRVGFHIGQLDFGSDRFQDFNADFGSNWWATAWTQVFSTGPNNSWHTVTAPLPAGEPSVWVAFWMDAEEGNYAKIDDIWVKCSQAIPEPGSLVLAAIGAAICGVVGLRRRFGNPPIENDR
jgi:hypothetical protein